MSERPMMNRRGFLKAAAAAFVAPSIIVPEQAERRFWQLDSTMTGSHPDFGDWDAVARWVEAIEPHSTPLLDEMNRVRLELERKMFHQMLYGTTDEDAIRLLREQYAIPSGDFTLSFRGPTAKIAPIPDEILDLKTYG